MSDFPSPDPNETRAFTPHACSHQPFQSQDGGGDADVLGDLYLVADPSTGARRVVEIWTEDGTRVLVLADIAQATVAQAESRSTRRCRSR